LYAFQIEIKTEMPKKKLKKEKWNFRLNVISRYIDSLHSLNIDDSCQGVSHTAAQHIPSWRIYGTFSMVGVLVIYGLLHRNPGCGQLVGGCVFEE
jgi:hypothetical protein